MNFLDELKLKYFCGSNVVHTYLLRDARRYERDIRIYCESPGGLNTNAFVWDVVDGPTWIPPAEEKLRKTLKDPVAALDWLRRRDSKFWKADDKGQWRPCAVDKDTGAVPGVFVMRDLALYMSSQEHFGLRRQLIEMCKQNTLSGFGRMIVMDADTPVPHIAISEFCDVIDYKLPSYADIEKFGVEEVWNTLRHRGLKAKDWTCDPRLQDRFVRALMGMSAAEAERILSQAWSASSGEITESMLEVIAAEKAKTIRKVKGLKFVPYAQIPDMNQFGGFDEFIPWVDETTLCYTPEAAAIGLEQPLGTCLICPAGTGKTTISFAIAKRMGLDALQIKLADLYDSKVGGTEQLTDSLFTMLRALPQVCAIFDEFEKGMGDAHQSQRSDAGVSARLLQAVLQLFSERDCNPDGNRMFVVLTMNRPGGVPAEAFRSGRLDRLWYAKLPTERECLNILKIHLAKAPRLLDPEHYGDKNLMDVVRAMDAFSGADIEALVRQARRTAFCREYGAWDRGDQEPPTRETATPTIDDLCSSVDKITRVAKMNASEINELDKFCSDIGARAVSSERAEEHDPAGRGRGIRGTVGSGASA